MSGEHTATVHGGDVARVAGQLGRRLDEFIELSASLNPCAPDVAGLAASRLDALDRYPDDTAATRALAAAIGIDPERLVLTNGGSEAIALVANELQSGEVIDPEFSLYRRHLERIVPGAGRWRSNPSNPLGALAPDDDQTAVWDEAFYALATGQWTRGDEGSWRLGSLTKLWACPGLRLGYVIAPTVDAARRIRTRRPQWSVNGLALALIEPLLERTDLPAWSTAIAAQRSTFAARLRSLGFEVSDTSVNWVLVHRPGLREALIPHGVVVRDCTSFGLPGVARVALPRPTEIDRVDAAFSQVARG